MKRIILLLFLFLSFALSAQTERQKASFSKGTMYGYWGYNRTGYTKSNIRFVGPGYDITMKGAIAHDAPEKFDPEVYFNPTKITIPQFNARIGYYFKDYWSISFGYDHMKYIFADNNKVLLSGSINPGIDTAWSGLYSGEEITTRRDQFHYENSDGLNYLRVEFSRTKPLLTTGKNDGFALSTNLGLSLGGILSFNDFTFAGEKDTRTISLSGYGLSGHLGIRIEFFRKIFIQPNLAFGFHHQIKVKNRPQNPNAFTRQAYGYYEANIVLGGLIHLRKRRSCDSCPIW